MSEKNYAFTRRTKEKYLAAFFLGALCLLLPLIPIMISNRGYFIYCGDYNAQQIPFYNMANDTVRSGGTFGWNWLTDLGSDFMTSYSFYLWGSPFFWISAALPRALVTFSMPFLLALKHGLASLTAYVYIRRFVRSKNAALIGGLLYACSGFQAYNIFFNHFQDVTAFFPLLLIAMEENINNSRKGIFAVTVAFMAILNYYFFTGQAVFLVLYYLFRMSSPDFNTSWKKFFILAFEAVAGTMIAGFILVPSALAIVTNHRVDSFAYGTDMVIYSDKTLIPRIIQSFFMPPDTPASPNLFNSDYEKWASIGGYLPLFSMAGVAAFIRGKKKHWAARLSACCIICSFIPVLNSIFQAMNSYYYARWFYMPILIFAMMTAESLDDADSDLRFGWIFCAAILAAFAVIGCLPTGGNNEKTKFFRLPSDPAYFWIVIAIAVCCLAGSALLFTLRKKGRTFMRLGVWMTTAASVICICTSVYYCASTIRHSRLYVDSVIKGKDSLCEEVSENNFFRIDISENCDNYSMLWGLPNMRAFQSVVNTSIMDFYQSIGMNRDVASRADPDHYTLRGLLSVKYYYRDIRYAASYNELEQLSSESSKNTDSGEKDFSNADITQLLPGFEYKDANKYFEFYENSLYIPMGFGYDSYISEKNAEKKTNSSREKLLISTLVLNENQIEKYSDILTEYNGSNDLTKDDYIRICKEKQQNSSSKFSYDHHGFRSEINLDKPQLVFFSVPYSDGWRAEVNGKAADVEKVSYGFMAVKAYAGENEIIFRYRTPGLTAGIIITAVGILLLVGYIIICHIFFKGIDPGHTHFYDYNPYTAHAASKKYCESRLGKD